MLTCWRVLIPQNSMAGFEEAAVALEMMLRRAEAIEM
jgi:hypothetical protein